MIHLRRRIVEQIIFFPAVITFAFLRSCSLGFHGKANVVLLTARHAEVDKRRFAFLADSEYMRLLDVVEVKE